METKVIYFVHGTTTDNVSGKCSGWKQVELTELGKERAINLGKLRKNTHFDVIFTSDLVRAIDSANYVFGESKTILYDKRIRECNYGDLNGKSTSLVIDEEHIESKFPNGESLKDVENRLRDFCKYLLENYDGKTVALVAHKAPQLALEVITKNISWEQALKNDWRKTKSWKPGWRYEIIK